MSSNPSTPARTQGVVFLAVGIALFATGVVLDQSAVWTPGIALVAIGTPLLARRRRGMR